MESPGAMSFNNLDSGLRWNDGERGIVTPT
jgi:hypothetical protein